MGEQRALDYFRTLSELMLTMEVTDGRAATLSLDQGAERAIQAILEVRSASSKVMLTGNGGSSAIVSHVQNDLCKAVGVRALVFTEQPLLTALANDHGYGCVFQRPLELWAEPGDLLLAVSSSGKSENILRAARAALEKGCRVITLSGFSPDNPLRQMGDLNFYVPSDVYGYVETAHAALAHFITDRAKSIAASQPAAEVGV
jgi:D-sedoheptulose 7-phosphate isomerase